MQDKIKLYAFNNLTKTLSFNIYDVCYAKSEREQKDYIAYIDEQYNSERLTKILCDVTDIIGANVLSISKQDYDPQGASVNLMISDESMIPSQPPVSHITADEVMLQQFILILNTILIMLFQLFEWIYAFLPAVKYLRLKLWII